MSSSSETQFQSSRLRADSSGCLQPTQLTGEGAVSVRTSPVRIKTAVETIKLLKSGEEIHGHDFRDSNSNMNEDEDCYESEGNIFQL